MFTIGFRSILKSTLTLIHVSAKTLTFHLLYIYFFTSIGMDILAYHLVHTTSSLLKRFPLWLQFKIRFRVISKDFLFSFPRSSRFCFSDIIALLGLNCLKQIKGFSLELDHSIGDLNGRCVNPDEGLAGKHCDKA